VLEAFYTSVQGAGVKTCFKAAVGALKSFLKAFFPKAGGPVTKFFGGPVTKFFGEVSI
jgi:hypothetical protein